MPVQAKDNGLQLCTIPTELSNLNALELRLISLRVPFMKMVALPSGKQRCIHGPAVNVPSKLDSICTMLPRLPSQSELIALKLKRKLAYRGHYMYDYISPERVMNSAEGFAPKLLHFLLVATWPRIKLAMRLLNEHAPYKRGVPWAYGLQVNGYPLFQD